MNTSHIKSFVYVAKYNSISKAAFYLNYSNSTVQGHIKTLELELDTKLYKRTNSGIHLTENGILFLDYAKRILDIVDEVLRTFKAQDQIIRITASETVNFFLMDVLINKFIKKYPQMDIEYAKATTDTAIEKLTTNQCDVSLISEPHYSSSKVKCDFFCHLSLSFVASPNHRCFREGLMNSREYNTLFCTMTMPVITEFLMRSGLSFSDYFSAHKNIGDIKMLHELAYEGQAITLLPTALIKEDLENGRLRIVPELNQEFLTNIYILTPLEDSSKQEIIANFINLAHKILSC